MEQNGVRQVEFHSGASRILLRGRFITPSLVHGKVPLIIMLTGDGTKGTNSPTWANLPPRLVTRGIASFLFDFAGLGNSDGDRDQLTLTQGIADFQAAFTLARSQEWVDVERLGLFGSSFGAAAALLRPDLANQTKMIGLKSPAGFLADGYVNECQPGGLDKWISEGVSEAGYRIEVLRDALRHNVYQAAQQIRTKVLISHGDKDDIVPIRQSKYLLCMLGGEKRLEVFAGVGHNYSEEGAWERMADLFVRWFGDNL